MLESSFEVSVPTPSFKMAVFRKLHLEVFSAVSYAAFAFDWILPNPRSGFTTSSCGYSTVHTVRGTAHCVVESFLFLRLEIFQHVVPP